MVRDRIKNKLLSIALVYANGNSDVIAIEKDILKRYNIQRGDEMGLYEGPEGSLLLRKVDADETGE